MYMYMYYIKTPKKYASKVRMVQIAFTLAIHMHGCLLDKKNVYMLLVLL